MRRNLLHEPIVLLQIDRQIGRRLLANLGKRRSILVRVDSDPNHMGARTMEIVHESYRGIDIGRMSRRHALYGYRMLCSNINGANLDRTCGVAFDFHETSQVFSMPGLILYRTGNFGGNFKGASSFSLPQRSHDNSGASGLQNR